MLQHVHRRKAIERTIRTFKSQFMSILPGVDAAFPNYLWNKLLPHAEITLNQLQQSTLFPAMSAWEHCYGLFNYNDTPIGPAG